MWVINASVYCGPRQWCLRHDWSVLMSSQTHLFLNIAPPSQLPIESYLPRLWQIALNWHVHEILSLLHFSSLCLSEDSNLTSWVCYCFCWFRSGNMANGLWHSRISRLLFSAHIKFNQGNRYFDSGRETLKLGAALSSGPREKDGGEYDQLFLLDWFINRITVFRRSHLSSL